MPAERSTAITQCNPYGQYMPDYSTMVIQRVNFDLLTLRCRSIGLHARLLYHACLPLLTTLTVSTNRKHRSLHAITTESSQLWGAGRIRIQLRPNCNYGVGVSAHSSSLDCTHTPSVSLPFVRIRYPASTCEKEIKYPALSMGRV